MTVGRETLQNRLHVATVLICAWLILSSPWVSMLRRIPTGAGVLEWAHVVLGFVGLVVGLAYGRACVTGGRWRLYFPWLTGEVRPVARDVAGIVRGRLPSAEGGGLFAVIEGLLLLVLVVLGITGAAWFWLQGSADAIQWRATHVVGARVLIGLVLAHLLAVATHLVELA